jgi:transcription antitermination factor NusG
VVAVCKPSMARGVAEDLNELGLVAYCPLSRKVHLRARARVGRRKIIRQYPVFGVYIFVGEVDGPLQASIHSGISYLVGDSQGALSVPESFVLAINQAELDGKWDETKGLPSWAKTFKRGDPVRVKEGPFTGFAGLVDACSKAGIRVDLDLFGRRTSTTLKPSALELA